MQLNPEKVYFHNPFINWTVTFLSRSLMASHVWLMFTIQDTKLNTAKEGLQDTYNFFQIFTITNVYNLAFSLWYTHNIIVCGSAASRIISLNQKGLDCGQKKQASLIPVVDYVSLFCFRARPGAKVCLFATKAIAIIPNHT